MAFRAPVAGRDYPQSARQLFAWFSDDAAVATWLERVRWRDGFRCPKCGCAQWRAFASQGAGARRCDGCRKLVTPSVGTVLAKARVPLTTWMEVGWAMSTSATGISGLAMERSHGISHEHAWTLLHRYREAMHRQVSTVELHGGVEVDETYIGGKRTGSGKRGRTPGQKECVLVAVERRKAGRVRMHRTLDARAVSLLPVVQQTVRPGALVLTDGHGGYNQLAALGYRHRPVSVRGSTAPAHLLLPVIHRVAALVKRWLLGTHQRPPSPKHLDHYLAEFCFRYNHRTARNRGLVFYRLIEAALSCPPTTFAAITSR